MHFYMFFLCVSLFVFFSFLHFFTPLIQIYILYLLMIKNHTSIIIMSCMADMLAGEAHQLWDAHDSHVLCQLLLQAAREVENGRRRGRAVNQPVHHDEERRPLLLHDPPHPGHLRTHEDRKKEN